MFRALNVVSGILVSQPSVPFVVRPATYHVPVRSRAFSGIASIPVMWLRSVRRLGFSLVLLLLWLLIQSSLMSPPRKKRTRPQSSRRLLSLILRLPRLLFRLLRLVRLFRLVRLPRRPRLSRLLLVLIKSPSSVSSAGPCPSHLIVRLQASVQLVLLRIIVLSIVCCPSRLSLSASVILLSPMFSVLFLTTTKRLLMPAKVNVRKYCICEEFIV